MTGALSDDAPPTDRRGLRVAHRSAAVLLVAGSLAACSGPAGPSAAERAYTPPTAPASVPVIEPGLPGEPARTVAPEDARAVDTSDDWSQGDADFVQAMVVHHRQALEMTAMAPERAQDADVAALAERIRLGQAPEVEVMEDWLLDRGLDVPPERSWTSGRGEVVTDGSAAGGGHHGTSAEPGHGMATTAQMQQLQASDGAAFDALFVDLMQRHHEGAVAMVEEHASAGVDGAAREMADEMAAVQTAELAHLGAVLDR